MAKYDGHEHNSFDGHTYWYKVYSDQVVYMHREGGHSVTTSHPIYSFKNAPSGHATGGAWTTMELDDRTISGIDWAAGYAASALPIMDYLVFVWVSKDKATAWYTDGEPKDVIEDEHAWNILSR